MKELIKNIIEKGGSSTIYFWGTLLLVEIILEVAVTVAIPQVRGWSTATVIQKDLNMFLPALIAFGATMTAFSIFSGLKTMMLGRVIMSLRVGLSKLTMKKWVVSRREDQEMALDNIDGRIAEDIRLGLEQFLELAIEIIISLLIVIGLVFSMVHQPLLLGVGVIYILFTLIISHRFQGPMVKVRTLLQEREQTLRDGLNRYRHGQGDNSFKDNLSALKPHYVHRMDLKGLFNMFFKFQNVALYAVPLLILFPHYVAGDITDSQLFASITAFDLLVINATIILQYFPPLMDAKASWNRVKEIVDHA